MATTSESYNATGPTVVGFETNPPDAAVMDFGVGAAGNVCGVHGVGPSAGVDTRRPPPEPAGVFGECSVYTGVFGVGNTGVRGIGNFTGMKGEGNNGVVGLCTLPDGYPAPGPVYPFFAGVAGLATTRTYVTGGMYCGFGVLGFSQANRAGVFATGGESPPEIQFAPAAGAVAQVHLAPIPFPDGGDAEAILPKDGVAGDLIALLDLQGNAQLWFCVRSGTEAQPVLWKQIA